MDMPLWMLAVLVGYFIKGVAGIGNTLVVTSAMSYTRTNAEITPVELLLCVPTNLAVTWVYRRHINWKLAIAPVLLMLILFIFVPALNSGTVGIMVPVSAVLTIAVGRVLYKRGVL